MSRVEWSVFFLLRSQVKSSSTHCIASLATALASSSKSSPNSCAAVTEAAAAEAAHAAAAAAAAAAFGYVSRS